MHTCLCTNTQACTHKRSDMRACEHVCPCMLNSCVCVCAFTQARMCAYTHEHEHVCKQASTRYTPACVHTGAPHTRAGKRHRGEPEDPKTQSTRPVSTRRGHPGRGPGTDSRPGCSGPGWRVVGMSCRSPLQAVTPRTCWVPGHPPSFAGSVCTQHTPRPLKSTRPPAPPRVGSPARRVAWLQKAQEAPPARGLEGQRGQRGRGWGSSCSKRGT